MFMSNPGSLQDMDDEVSCQPLRTSNDDEMKELQPPPVDENGDDAVEAQPEQPPHEVRADNPPGPARPAEQPSQQEPAENPPGSARNTKRVRYADMTPDSKAKEKQRRIDRHRANSDRWHEKWISKGVPREPKAGIADGASGSAASAGNAEAAGRAEPEQPPQEPEEILINVELMKEATCSKNRGLMFKVSCSDSFFCVQHLWAHMFILAVCIQAIDGDMRRVRVSYMQQWTSLKVSQGQSVKQHDANKAWLNSEIRAQILAARKGQQY